MKKLICILTFIVLNVQADAQCSFNPTINGDTLICPTRSDSIYTQNYGSYQWYRGYTSATLLPISGAVSQWLNLDYFNDWGYYYAVAATDSGCTEMSPVVYVDQWQYIDATVITTGNVDPNGPGGVGAICQWDTAFYTVLSPYDTNITWLFNGSIIPGAVSHTLEANATGYYNVAGASYTCPGMVSMSSTVLHLLVLTCYVETDEYNLENYSFYPNPVSQFIYIQSSIIIDKIEVYDPQGKLMLSENLSSEMKIDITSLDDGLYFCRIYKSGTQVAMKKVIVKK